MGIVTKNQEDDPIEIPFDRLVHITLVDSLVGIPYEIKVEPLDDGRAKISYGNLYSIITINDLWL